MDCGGQALLPAVRDAEFETVIVADGFSCKTQIEQAGTGRRALHVAEVIKPARHATDADAGHLPHSRPVAGQRPLPGWGRRLARGASVLGAVAATAALLRLAVRR